MTSELGGGTSCDESGGTNNGGALVHPRLLGGGGTNENDIDNHNHHHNDYYLTPEPGLLNSSTIDPCVTPTSVLVDQISGLSGYGSPLYNGGGSGGNSSGGIGNNFLSSLNRCMGTSLSSMITSTPNDGHPVGGIISIRGGTGVRKGRPRKRKTQLSGSDVNIQTTGNCC